MRDYEFEFNPLALTKWTTVSMRKIRSTDRLARNKASKKECGGSRKATSNGVKIPVKMSAPAVTASHANIGFDRGSMMYLV